MYSKLIDKAKKRFPAVSIKSSDEFFSWFNTIASDFIIENIVECKELKACGHISGKFSLLALSNGFPCFSFDGLGHITNIIITSDGLYEIDFTHLQFDFPTKGSLRDFSKEDRESNIEEYVKMKSLFKELESNPLKAVKITKIKDVNPDWLILENPITLANEILILFKIASSLISQ